MDFKCLFFDKEVRWVEKEININVEFEEFNIIESKVFSDGFVVIRIQRNQSPAKYGVCEKGNKIASPLIEELNGKDMVVQDFIIINQNEIKFSVYYSGKKPYVIEVLEKIYKISESFIISEVSIEDLVTISEIKVTAHKYGQYSLFHKMEEFPAYAEISGIFGNNDHSDKAEMKYFMNEKRKLFKRDELKKLIDKTEGNEFKKFTFEGYDIYGNVINYSDGIFAKKISVFGKDSYKMFSERKKLQLMKLKNAIKKVISSA